MEGGNQKDLEPLPPPCLPLDESEEIAAFLAKARAQRHALIQVAEDEVRAWHGEKLLEWAQAPNPNQEGGDHDDDEFNFSWEERASHDEEVHRQRDRELQQKRRSAHKKARLAFKDWVLQEEAIMGLGPSSIWENRHEYEKPAAKKKKRARCA